MQFSLKKTLVQRDVFVSKLRASPEKIRRGGTISEKILAARSTALTRSQLFKLRTMRRSRSNFAHCVEIALTTQGCSGVF
jgi:hypothetical protein